MNHRVPIEPGVAEVPEVSHRFAAGERCVRGQELLAAERRGQVAVAHQGDIGAQMAELADQLFGYGRDRVRNVDDLLLHRRGEPGRLAAAVEPLPIVHDVVMDVVTGRAQRAYHVHQARAGQGAKVYFCTLPSPSLVDVVRPLRAAGYHIHYDIMDDWEGFHRGGEAPWFSAPVEQEIVNISDTVTAVSEKLVRKFSHLRSDIALVRNGYLPSALGCEQFLAAHTPLAGRKTVGYFGHFSDAWFDWDAVIHAAKTLPDVDFELIGWAVSEPTRRRLEGLANLRL